MCFVLEPKLLVPQCRDSLGLCEEVEPAAPLDVVVYATLSATQTELKMSSMESNGLPPRNESLLPVRSIEPDAAVVRGLVYMPLLAAREESDQTYLGQGR